MKQSCYTTNLAVKSALAMSDKKYRAKRWGSEVSSGDSSESFFHKIHASGGGPTDRRARTLDHRSGGAVEKASASGRIVVLHGEAVSSTRAVHSLFRNPEFAPRSARRLDRAATVPHATALSASAGAARLHGVARARRMAARRLPARVANGPARRSRSRGPERFFFLDEVRHRAREVPGAADGAR